MRREHAPSSLATLVRSLRLLSSLRLSCRPSAPSRFSFSFVVPNTWPRVYTPVPGRLGTTHAQRTHARIFTQLDTYTSARTRSNRPRAITPAGVYREVQCHDVTPITRRRGLALSAIATARVSVIPRFESRQVGSILTRCGAAAATDEACRSSNLPPDVRVVRQTVIHVLRARARAVSLIARASSKSSRVKLHRGPISINLKLIKNSDSLSNSLRSSSNCNLSTSYMSKSFRVKLHRGSASIDPKLIKNSNSLSHNFFSSSNCDLSIIHMNVSRSVLSLH